MMGLPSLISSPPDGGNDNQPKNPASKWRPGRGEEAT
jgi:hypothetical protein